MVTIKSYTSVEQSKKLAEILPIESSDMYWDLLSKSNYAKVNNIGHCLCRTCVYAWSLAALLDVLSEIKPQVYTPILFPSEGKWILQFAEYGHGNICEVTCDNPVDACVAMIEKLHELKIL